ncbi:MAG: hypothetical protein RL197_1150 [Actinomycetota bacterium]|jgi:hypothetical protein
MFKAIITFVISLALVFPAFQPGQSALAAGCSVSGGQAGRLKHSGQVVGSEAKVCGREIWRLVGKPKTPIKQVKPTKPSKPIRWKNEFSVAPDRPRIISSHSSKLAPNESVVLDSSAVRHVRNRMLLWYPTQVRFKPIASRWLFPDGSSVVGASIAKSWDLPGSYKVLLTVDYSVKYRILGRSDWVVLPGTVASNASPVTFTVAADAVANRRKIVLVHWNCLQKPMELGC